MSLIETLLVIAVITGGLGAFFVIAAVISDVLWPTLATWRRRRRCNRYR